MRQGRAVDETGIGPRRPGGHSEDETENVSAAGLRRRGLPNRLLRNEGGWSINEVDSIAGADFASDSSEFFARGENDDGRADAGPRAWIHEKHRRTTEGEIVQETPGWSPPPPAKKSAQLVGGRALPAEKIGPARGAPDFRRFFFFFFSRAADCSTASAAPI